MRNRSSGERGGVEGTVYVLLDTNRTRHDADATSDRTADRTELVEEMRDRIASLEHQLEQERDASRRKDHLLAAALERIPPQLEAPQEPRESPESAGPSDAPTESTEGPQEPAERVSWWQRWFGGRE
jgi:hypothetical protein